MSPAKVAVACGLAALCTSACGVQAKPQAGSAPAVAALKKNVDDPRTAHVECLQQEHVPVRLETIGGDPGFQVGVRPSGPTVQFLSTPGAAQEQQIKGGAQGAEIIGSALVYPNQSPAGLMDKVETCVEKGVSG